MPNYPSIFNDVIGPVMRGPSSSHCAASLRIGRLARDLMDGNIDEVWIEFDTNGSLAATHESQGADMGLFGGLLGWDAHDERMLDSTEAIRKSGIAVHIEVTDLGASHPNTCKLTLTNPGEAHQVTAVSTGGGMIEIVEIDGAAVSIRGDFFETLVYVDGDEEQVLAYIRENARWDDISFCNGGRTAFILVKAQGFPDRRVCAALELKKSVRGVRKLSPVLPIRSRNAQTVPFVTCRDMIDYNHGKNLALWELAVLYESARGGITSEAVYGKMRQIAGIMRKSVRRGLQGTAFGNRILGFQSGAFKTRLENGALLDAGILNHIILSVTAVMEVKSAMGVIVAAPTAGSCGTLPGVCIGAADVMGLTDDAVIRGLLAAGMIGIFVSAQSTFAAEVGGCQAECGVASGMAAAALVSLAGGTALLAVDAASMALQNIFGMTCDPVANRVEVPCLGKNVLAAGNAVSSANMALAGFDPVIPLDEVIEAMDAVGKSLPAELRCTARGGLSITKTSREIADRLGKYGGIGNTKGDNETC